MKVRRLRSVLYAVSCALYSVVPITAQIPNSEHTLRLDKDGTLARARVQDVAWIAGHWTGQGLGGVADEIWSEPRGGSMVGTFRLVRDNKTIFYEVCALVEETGTVKLRIKHFHPDLTGWEEKNDVQIFPLIKVTADEIFFDRMTYRKAADGSLEVVLALEDGKTGRTSEERFLYEREVGPSADNPQVAAGPARQEVTDIVAQIQKADYEGDRPGLRRFYEELTPFVQDKELASRVRYWHGFALWRRALNGFNESFDPKEQEQDLTQAVNEFDKAAALDPGLVDAKIGAESCLSFLVGQSQGNPARVQELMARAAPLRKEIEAVAPENPRYLWVLGNILWYVPPERGGGQAKAMETYQKGLEAARKQKGSVMDPLEPSWGEPELLMSLAGANLYRTTPDLNAAEQYARSALALVPYWHYVRDILIPQITAAKLKAPNHSSH